MIAYLSFFQVLVRHGASRFVGLIAFFSTLVVAVSNTSAVEPLNFNRDIRPILSENCFYCHGQDSNKREADLRLDLREGAIESGAIVPGDLTTGGLIHRIDATGDELMPPAKSNRRLSDVQKATLKRWIEEGATYSPHWAFEKPARPTEPAVQKAGWARNPIDAFVLARIEAAGLEPSAEADKTTLIKRLYVDLIGLPPSPEEIDAFVADADPMAYEKLVDRLFSDKHYGERMALPWLDAARYADSNGFQQDGDTWQWMWRDWVVNAYNNNMPFDKFTIEQLAGDLLPDATTENKIASGFNRNHLLNGEGGAIAEEQRFVILFDRMDTTATNWLGLTMACAQCHDHKYDPITQRDYYSLMEAFNRIPESGVPQFFSSRIRVAPPVIELPTEENKAKIADFEKQIAALDQTTKPIIDAVYDGWKVGILADNKPADGKELPEPLVKLLSKPEAERNDQEKQSIETDLRKHFDQKVRPKIVKKYPDIEKIDSLRSQLNSYRNDQIPRPMIMSDAKPRETFILDRGEYLSPKEKVEFATPSFLPPMPDDLPKNRLGLAKWLVSPDHPLTARVQINRIWQHFFGSGIVKTSEDFGVQSEYPIHGQLLDWMAVDFVESGWNVKAIQRKIVTSATYRQSSRVSEKLRQSDAENRLYARASRFRMPSMLLRDWALATSGLLQRKLGGAPVYPYQPDGVWEALAITKERDFTYPASTGPDLYRRSLYTFWRRTVGPTNIFDASNRQSCRVRSSLTSTPLHALTTLNDPTWVESARVLAQEATKHSATLNDQIRFAFKKVVCRNPSEKELGLLKRAYHKQAAIYAQEQDNARSLVSVGASPKADSVDIEQLASLTSVCLAILNLDESMTRE